MDLATIRDAEDQETLKTLKATFHSRAWIGLYHYFHNWKWSLSNTSLYKPGETEFRRWISGEPNNHGNDQNCVEMNSNGEWYDDNCWRPYNSVCFDVRGPNTYVVTPTSMTWTEGQSYCREHHTDLASVRNMEENQMVHNLIPSSSSYVWIGLFRDPWNWSDGSESLFRNWSPLEPRTSGSSETCVAADFSADGQWEIMDCNVKSAFICYGDFVPVSKRVVKVRLEKSSSSLDLNDPVVMEDLLKQVHLPLINNMTTAYVRRYFVVNELKTRTEAQRHCRENYMDLATIRDPEDLETLKTLKATFHSVSFMLSVTGGLNVVHLQSWKVCR
ncbi:Macrophage mannose receptor 1 [Liparis tanakae]|uniref:Macrophage mannose receptor 1 n=1 Tax=Liparis tanakae TaxID=230148 RepID=A0A4Z2GT60_9TELE|nr:Macrophage mannose receptor 1 [Liparis tanakae]